MNYSEMSDTEVNTQACKELGKVISSYCRIRKVGDSSILLDDNETLFNPCNSWADAGPIIQESGIELNYDGISWSAASRFRDVGWYSDWKNYPESPLRIAMIVFLMIKDKEANNESH